LPQLQLVIAKMQREKFGPPLVRRQTRKGEEPVAGFLKAPERLHDEISADYKGMVYGTMATSSSTRHHFKELGLARTYVSSGTFGVANHPFPAVSPFVEVSRETGSDRLTGVCLVVRISRRRIDLEAGRFAVRAEPQVYPGER
jgi:hypothetical protein